MGYTFKPENSDFQPLSIEGADHCASAVKSFTALSRERQEIVMEYPDLRALYENPGLTEKERSRQIVPILRRIQAERKSKLDKILMRQKGMEAIIPWARRILADGDLILEKNDCSRMHKLEEAWENQCIFYSKGDDDRQKEGFFGRGAHVFVVQHNWLSAFNGAEDFDGGDFNLPFSFCAFEFRFSGRTIITFCMQPEAGTKSAICFIEAAAGTWYCPEDTPHEKEWNGWLETPLRHVRAICIALDSEVAQQDVQRAPHKLNCARIKEGRVPLHDFHIVSLNRKHRSRGPGTGTHRSPRLHFRRGHWRHYVEHKTWIRWTLVGDPDLGFIGKNYAL